MEEQKYIQKRIWIARLQSILFYLCRIFPVKRRKIVFCCIEGTTGYTCNPKYIAEELIRRKEKFELVWLVDDISKSFPREIKVVHNTLLNRAYQLTTAHFWIDNSRKQLEVRKRKGQIYIQTWHAKLGFKPTCLDRGDSFSKIAYIVSKHDSDMIDYVISNSKWYDDTLATGMIYSGQTLRIGSPRCDILVNGGIDNRSKVRNKYQLPADCKILIYAPTFRGGSQETNREIRINEGFPDFNQLCDTLNEGFGGKWYIFLRLHPQLVVRNLGMDVRSKAVIDISKEDDLYEILAGCDAFMTDYSSAAFDAAVMKIPVFLYVQDCAEYEKERGRLLWDLHNLPFPVAVSNDELQDKIRTFNAKDYNKKLQQLFLDTDMLEDGKASSRMVDIIEKKVIE